MTTGIRFDDGAIYERYMGGWSRMAGEAFLDWLGPAPQATWLDVGCGSGAFSALLAERHQATVHGIDPSAQQIAFARQRMQAGDDRFQVGDAMALPHGNAAFDAAVMALVVFFVPDPAKGVAEMARVTRPGGWVTAYAWDMLEGGFPYAAVHDALRDIGVPPPLPPSVAVSRRDALVALWAAAGLEQVDTCLIEVSQQYRSVDEFWAIARSGPSTSASTGGLSEAQKQALRERVMARLSPHADGSLIITARAHGIKGRVPQR
jgi:SAM-dependent methyltransferase